MYGETTVVDEGFLVHLGVHRLPVPVPFVEAGGPVNVYAIDNADGSLTLFDSGVNTEEGFAALERGAELAQVDLGRLSRIIISHGHVDHFGNAQRLAQRTGAKVFVHEGDRAKLRGERYFAMLVQHADYFVHLGVSRELLDSLVKRARAGLEGDVIEERWLEPLVDGQLFRFKHFDARVEFCPGHTPGLCCLYAPAQRLFFASDHLLARVSPNPLLDLSQGVGETKFLSLVSYMRSARRVRDLAIDCVLPGHGEAFTGHRSLVDGLLEFYARRQDKLLGWLRTRPATAYELTEALFVRRDLGRLVLMLSEVLANVEVLESEGRVARSMVEGRWLFSPSAARDAS